jgi:uncharacterized protein
MIRGIFKIVLISILTISFTACEKKQKEEEKEVKFTPKLAMPESGKLREMGLIGLWYDAKHDPIPATKIGYAYSEELKDYEKAIQWYKYSDSMIPLGENSYFTCYAYQQLKQYDEAIKWCQNSIDLKWDEALFRMGKVLELKKEFSKAVDYYKQAFDKTKDATEANNLGLIYSLELNKIDEAEQWFKKAIKEGSPLAYKNISIFYHKKLNDDIKASAYAIAVINTEYTESSVIKLLKDEWKIPNETIKKGYELQLNSPDFPIKYKGEL